MFLFLYLSLYYLARNLVAFCSVGVGWMEIVLTIALSVTVAIIADLIKHRDNQPTYHMMIMMMKARMKIIAIMVLMTFTITLTITTNVVITKIIILIMIIIMIIAIWLLFPMCTDVSACITPDDDDGNTDN